jgi:tRNA pseudouridine38-40 synthase
VSRTYRYVLYNHAVRPALHYGRVGWFHLPLDPVAMRAAAAHLAGEHDFSAFRSSECQAKSPVRTLRSWAIERRGAQLNFEFTANGFLHHMVRNIIGCLVYVGKGKHPPGWLGEVLASRDRRQAAPTFSPDGLYLAAVEYAPGWKLPAFEPKLVILEANKVSPAGEKPLSHEQRGARPPLSPKGTSFGA